MGNRKKPTTSTEAYRSLEPDKIRAMHTKIVKALEIIGPATYEELATHMREKPERVWKRLSEAGRLNLIHRPGDRKIMSSGRQGFVWSVGPSPEPVKKKERLMKGKNIADFSRAINQVQQSLNSVEKLF